MVYSYFHVFALRFIFNYMFMCRISAWICGHANVGPQNPKKMSDPLGLELSYPHDVNAENQSWVLWKNNKHS